MNVKYFLVCFIIQSVNGKSRQKRHLRFPKGASFTVTVAISTFLPKDILPAERGFAHIIEFDYSYPFPERVALDRPKPTTKKPTIYYDPHFHSLISNRRHRIKRSKIDDEKEEISAKLQEIISSFGYDGPSCSIRFQCELQRLSPNHSMLADILLVLFSPSTFPQPLICENSLKTCDISILQILHSEKVTNPESFF